jgi:hypothetical protein
MNSLSSKRRGFQHVYKSTSTTFSLLRVHAAHKATLKNGVAWSWKAMKCNKKKQGKIDNLKTVLALASHSLDTTFLESNPVFFSGTSKKIIPNSPPQSYWLQKIFT